MSEVKFNEDEFNGIAYSYRAWPMHDQAGVIARHRELLEIDPSAKCYEFVKK